MTDFDRARILVLGDSGVGKSSLVHLIARGKPLSHITYTIGASNEVKLHEYKEGTPSQRTYWIGKTLIFFPPIGIHNRGCLIMIVTDKKWTYLRQLGFRPVQHLKMTV